MENGVYAERGLVAMERDVDDVVLQAAAVLAGDGRKEMMAGGKLVEEVEEEDEEGEEEEEEEEDVYSMDVSDELDKSNMFVVKRAATPAAVDPELDMNDPPKEEDVTMTSMSLSINNGSASESEVATERGPAEIQIAAASGKEDVRDLNEAPTGELENESEEEVTIVNEASPAAEAATTSTPVERDFLQAVDAPEVAQEAAGQEEVAKAEVMERAAIRPTLDVNEPPEAVKMAEEMHPEVAAFRIVKAEEAKSLHDVEAKMVGLTPGGEQELFRAVVHMESKPEVPAKDWEKPELASVRAEEPSASRGQLNMATTMAFDMDTDGAKERVPEGVAPKTERTELEREMELYEAAEREEQARLLGPLRTELQREEPVKESQNEKKRALDMPMPERQRKLSRKMHSGEERKKDEEDVCFICFDGGDLVLCDRRSCPKAYHLSCIGRDAAFFKKKGAWLCGWHFCSVCTKPGSFQCYTCPTAYCGSCITKAEFLLLRKRKGLCEDCLPIVSMIERNETINSDGVEVDFDDQETYECLFKEYWGDLKRRLALVMPELDKDGKPVGGTESMLQQLELEAEDHSENDESDRESDESEHDEPEAGDGTWKKRKVQKNRMGSEKMEEDVEAEDLDEEEEEGEQEAAGSRSQKFESWASEELLEFIEHMKEDPMKPLSRFAVNKLLWTYIKRHKLQDPRQSSQINCDERLKTIFGKDSVGQIEMFKHLQVHFPSRSSGEGRKGREAVVDGDAVGADGVEEKVEVGGGKERRKGRRSVDEKFDRPNGSEFAAITPKNISLIYLRRALLRDLLDDPEFDNKVVDTFVRIRVPGISTKTETTYRLVLVTGTRIGEESYKAGTKMTNIVLEILNLQKKEDVTVDLVSNQDFTEEECQRLRQSMKCGFIKAPTVGELEEKAIALQEARVNDWFENERQRLINLRDRASEKGRKKELRECVEKLQELSSPAFRAAKLQARPEVTADPHMDPNYESDTNEKSPLNGGGQKFRLKSSSRERGGGSGVSTWDSSNADESGYLGRKGDFDNPRSKPSWDETGRSRGYGRGGYDGGRGREKFGYGMGGRIHGNDERDRGRVWEKEWERDPPPREQERSRGEGYNWNGNGGRADVDQWGGELGDSKYGRGEARAGTTPVFGQARTEWGSSRREAVASLGLSVPAVGFGSTSPSVQSLAALEKEKLWHYKDPTGTVQGPFTMEQLRKWNTTGLFPVNLTIWKTGGSQENSMLLTDALAGRFKEEVLGLAAPRSRSREFGAGGSPPARGGASWGVGEVGPGVSRAELGSSVGSADWDSRDVGERGGSWARGQSGYGSGPSSTGRADDWSGSRSRAESESWGSSRKGADGASWGAGEASKSSFSRCSSGRDYDGPVGRDGPRSSRVSRGSRKDVPCRFYAKGYCKRGDTCEFWHG
ncbi:hypothetical protein KC19_7G136400 [Ceratodon purpureus]|uniref:Uncharacterized protein n=1 Tax=Ceratodon purpureus TaxID=3225 RepID=A0A8T0H893_CERPU|nr:hypothetical protein KC19_7G136400 [Ceratodon purpureus]